MYRLLIDVIIVFSVLVSVALVLLLIVGFVERVLTRKHKPMASYKRRTTDKKMTPR